MDDGCAFTQEDAVRIERLETFVEMVLRSVEGGGNIVTFSDDDIAEMKSLLGASRERETDRDGFSSWIIDGFRAEPLE